MFNTTSKAGVGMWGFLIFTLLTTFGYDPTALPESWSIADLTLGQTVTIAIWMWGQLDRVDLDELGLFRKKEV